MYLDMPGLLISVLISPSLLPDCHSQRGVPLWPIFRWRGGEPYWAIQYFDRGYDDLCNFGLLLPDCHISGWDDCLFGVVCVLFWDCYGLFPGTIALTVIKSNEIGSYMGTALGVWGISTLPGTPISGAHDQ
jgi:hypothetical protein